MKLHTRSVIVALALTCVAAGLLASSASAAAPVNNTVPTITGTPQQGKTLTASNGTWSNSPNSFSYRWQRCAADGTGCGNIDNAVSKTYLLKEADVDRTIRVVVTASNSDGQTSANSKTTDIISATTAPKNTALPKVAGTPQPGEELTADPGTWTGGASSYAFQWQRCNTTGGACVDVTGATGRSYGVRAVDIGSTLRISVTAKNLAGSTTANSDATAIVRAASAPPPPTTTTNRRPTISILSVRFVGARVYARFRVCDDSSRNLRITERDSKVGVRSYTRNFATLVPPRPCAALTRNWLPAPRFRHGRYTLTLTARDAFGLTSLAARRTFSR